MTADVVVFGDYPSSKSEWSFDTQAEKKVSWF